MIARSLLPPLRFAVIGADHGHVTAMTEGLQAAGAELVGFHGGDAVTARTFAERTFVERCGRDVPRSSAEALLNDDRIGLIVSASPPHERAAIGLRALRAGKSFLAAKPAFLDLADIEAARRAVGETGRRFYVWYAERLASPAVLHAERLTAAGAIGRVVQVTALAPHSIGTEPRPGWFFEPSLAGGVLADLSTHFMDQFLAFTGARTARILSSVVANHAHAPHLTFQDWGEVHVASDGVTGYGRVDWLSPGGLGTWGDGRLIVLGTEGYIEVRRNIDLAGRAGGEHLFHVDRDGVRHVDCARERCTFFERLVRDIAEGAAPAMDPYRGFLASELAVRAQHQAHHMVTSSR